MAYIRFHSDFIQRSITPEMEITRTRKKKKKHASNIFPWGIHVWNFKTLACTVFDNSKPICPVNTILLCSLSVILWVNILTLPVVDSTYSVLAWPIMGKKSKQEVKSPVSGTTIYRKLTTILFPWLCWSRTIYLSIYLSIYLYILSQPRKEDIRTGAQRHRAKKKKEYKAR